MMLNKSGKMVSKKGDSGGQWGISFVKSHLGMNDNAIVKPTILHN